MMTPARLVALALVAALLLAAPAAVAAQDEQDDAAEAAAELDEFDDYEEDDEEDYEMPVMVHPDITTSVYFPDATIKIGERNSVVVAVSNSGRDSFNVTAMGAHLHSPFDFTYHIQNFTAYRIEGSSIGPGQQASVEYFFTPDKALEPHDSWLSAWMLYNNSNQRMFVNTVYNGTVTLVDEQGVMDAKGVLSNVFFFGILAALGYGLYTRFGPKKKRAAAADAPAAIPKAKVEIYRPKEQARKRK